jgi:hypothetical protein
MSKSAITKISTFFLLFFSGIFLYVYSNSPIKQHSPIRQYYCTAADKKFFAILLNLIGSLHHTNFENIEEIAVYDLGLEQDQITTLNNIQKVRVYNIELTHPDLLKPVKVDDRRIVPGWYAWKPVAIKQSLDKFPYVLWIDAGSTVLKPLDDLFVYIQKQGYFLATIGDTWEPEKGKFRCGIEWQTTRYVRNKFNLDDPKNVWIFNKEAVMGGIIGVAQSAKDVFIMPLYEMTKDLRAYIDDGTAPGGFGCGRHDQALLSILAYLGGLTIHKQDRSQRNPIQLSFDGKTVPLYITWVSQYVCDKTHIYSSHGDIKDIKFYAKCIKVRK